MYLWNTMWFLFYFLCLYMHDILRKAFFGFEGGRKLRSFWTCDFELLMVVYASMLRCVFLRPPANFDDFELTGTKMSFPNIELARFPPKLVSADVLYSCSNLWALPVNSRSLSRQTSLGWIQRSRRFFSRSRVRFLKICDTISYLKGVLKPAPTFLYVCWIQRSRRLPFRFCFLDIYDTMSCLLKRNCTLILVLIAILRHFGALATRYI